MYKETHLTLMKTSSGLGCMLTADSVSPFKKLKTVKQRLLGQLAGGMPSWISVDMAKSPTPLPEAAPLNLAERRQVDLALREWIGQEKDTHTS